MSATKSSLIHILVAMVVITVFLAIGYTIADLISQQTLDSTVQATTAIETGIEIPASEEAGAAITSTVSVAHGDAVATAPPPSPPGSATAKKPGTLTPTGNITASKVHTGKSRQGRPIEAVTFGQQERTVLVIGGIHGDESAGVTFTRTLIQHLQGTAEQHLTQRIVVIPLANPDGFAARTRGNSRSIDINRNFPTKDFSKGRQSGRYNGGSSPESEVETKFLMSVIAQYQPGLILTFHNPLACVNYDGPAKAIAATLASTVNLPLKSSIGYATPGSLGTYYGVERRVPVITLEFPADAASWQRYGPGVQQAIGVKTSAPPSHSTPQKPVDLKNSDRTKLPMLTKIVVSKSQNRMRTYARQTLVKEYIVSTGIKNCSPVGTFKVIGKSSHPGCADLGTRWLALNRWHSRTGRQFGIHGTNEPHRLGGQYSRGCIRLRNTDVEELYDITSLNTIVVITNGNLQ